MNSLEWLKRRRDLAAEAEISALEPSQTSVDPRAGLVSPREIPDKSPRIPEDSYLNICTKNIFSLAKEEGGKNIMEARENIEGLGARRGGTGIVGAKEESKAPLATNAPAQLTIPYLNSEGTLVIPFAADPKYFWWKDGQSVKATMAEVLARIASEKASAASGLDNHG